MKSNILHPWIEAGYRTFALEGPHALKVEQLSRTVEKNKSSFYHHFADLTIYTSALLDHHFIQAEILAEKEGNSRNVAELSEVLVEHKIDLLFNRQLRVHRDNPEYAACFDRVTTLSAPKFVPVWTKLIGLNDNTSLGQTVLQLSLENFFLQITYDTINEVWITSYIENVRNMVKQFKSEQVIELLNGAV